MLTDEINNDNFLINDTMVIYEGPLASSLRGGIVAAHGGRQVGRIHARARQHLQGDARNGTKAAVAHRLYD